MARISAMAPNIGAAQREKAMNRSGFDRKAGAGIMGAD